MVRLLSLRVFVPPHPCTLLPSPAGPPGPAVQGHREEDILLGLYDAKIASTGYLSHAINLEAQGPRARAGNLRDA